MIKPVKGLTLSTSGSYLDAVYTDYTFSPPAGYLLPTGATNLSGTPLPLPKWQASYGASYTLPVTKVAGLEWDEGCLRQWPQTWLCGPTLEAAGAAPRGAAIWRTAVWGRRRRRSSA